MTENKVLTQEYQVTAEIPLAFMRYLETRSDERVLEVVLVYNGVDRFDTIIEPTGMKTDPSVVTVDYNHCGVNTGAYLRNTRVETNYKLEDGTVLEQALVGDIHIPKDSEMFFMDKDGQKRSNGNLFEAVTKGQVRSVSVEFRPYQGKQITDTKSGITTYKEWDLLRLSLLDVTPGQPYSSIKITRSLINNNNMQTIIENIKTALTAGEISKEELRALLEPTETTPKSEDEDGIPGQRDITIEPASAVAPAADSEETPPNADVNEDGEITDEEARSYIKEIKRMYSDPKMIQEKMGDLERMCGDLTTRMDGLTIKDEDPEEVEAQRIRALNKDLNNVPDEVKTAEVDKAKRSLEIGGEDLTNQELKRFTIEDMQNTNLKSRLAQLTK